MEGITGKIRVGNILNGSRIIKIPFFQRRYVWEEGNWERFFDDVSEVIKGKKPHFMGPIILKQQTTPTSGGIGEVRTLIDGQQRMTTLMIFYKCLAHMFPNKSEYYNQKLLTIPISEREILLQHNYQDKEIFEKILREDEPDNLKEIKDSSKILACYKYFRRKTENNPGNWNEGDCRVISDKIYFYALDLDSDEDEQEIFDTMNSLSVPLTTAELLKNFLFKKDDWDLYEKTWQKKFEGDDSDFWDLSVGQGKNKSQKKNIDLLLYSFLLITSTDNTNIYVEKLYNAYREHLKKKHKEAGDEEFINDIIAKSDIYREHINSEQRKECLDPNSAMDKINLLIFATPITPLIPYVMYILTNVDDTAERDKIFNFMISYFCRRIVCKLTTKHYNLLLAGFIKGGIDSLEKLKEEFRDFEKSGEIDKFPNNNDLKLGFENSNLVNERAKLILYLLELYMRGDKESTDLKAFSGYELEHILPKSWKENWKEDRPMGYEEESSRDDYLKRIGNLTLLTPKLNNSIKNLSWKEKKTGRGRKYGLQEYAKGLKTFDDAEGLFLKSPQWDEDTIKKRGQFLYEQAIKYWSDLN